MKSDVIKNVLRVILAILVIVCIWTVTDKIFSAVNAGDNIEAKVDILPEGSVCNTSGDDIIPAVVRNFEINLRYDNGTEIIKHYDVRGKNPNDNIYGYVQIWKAEQGLDHYLKISKEYMSANVHGFREGTLKTGGVTWITWEYIVNDIAVSQAFNEKDGLITICNLCVPYQEKTYEFGKIFTELLESIVA